MGPKLSLPDSRVRGAGSLQLPVTHAAIAVEPETGPAVGPEMHGEAARIGDLRRALRIVHRLNGMQLPMGVRQRVGRCSSAGG